MLSSPTPFSPRVSGPLALLWVLALSAVRLAGSAPPAYPVPQPRQPGLRLPLAFEENRGQAAGGVRFLSRARGGAVLLTEDEMVLALGSDTRPGRRARRASTLRLRLPGARRSAPRGEWRLPGCVNYLIGRDPAAWRTDIPTYAAVRRPDVYPGIDLLLYGRERQLEYDFVVAPGADPSCIRLAFDGADSATLRGGDLVLHTPAGVVRQRRPVVYQEIEGRRTPVDSGYQLAGRAQPTSRDEHHVMAKTYCMLRNTERATRTRNTQHVLRGTRYATRSTPYTSRFTQYAVTFRLGPYDRSRPLIIDPVLLTSSFLGGSRDDTGNGIAMDALGNAYITGTTLSPDFPTANPLQGTINGGFGLKSDAFITKLNPAGTVEVYSTFLGGSEADEGLAITVDGAAQACITGTTRSPNFPIARAFQTEFIGGGFSGTDSYVAKLNAAGNAFVYSSFLGGENSDTGLAIAVDSRRNVYLSGSTYSSTGIATSGAYQPNRAGDADGFLMQVADPVSGNPATLAYATYLGGDAFDAIRGLAVGAGGVYVTGGTESANFPTTPGAFQAGGAGGAFVARFNLSDHTLAYSTELYGSMHGETGFAIDVDSTGSAYVTGSTPSSDFPLLNALQAVKGAGYDVFVTRLHPNGGSLLNSTLLGGRDPNERGTGIRVFTDGSIFLAGRSSGSSLPIGTGALAGGGGIYAGDPPSFAPFNRNQVLSDVKPAPDGGVVMTTNDGAVLRGSDTGASPRLLLPAVTSRPALPASAPPGDVYWDPFADPNWWDLFFGEPGVYHSSNRGATWRRKKLPGRGYAVAPGVGAATLVGGLGVVYRSTDHGDTWTSIPLPGATAPMIHLARDPGDGTKAFASDGTHFWQTFDGGQHWIALSGPPIEKPLQSMRVLTDGRLVVTYLDTSPQPVWTYTATGWFGINVPVPSAFTIAETPASTMVRAGRASRAAAGLYLGTDNGIYNSTDGGMQWSPAGLQGTAVTALGIRSTSRFYAVSDGGQEGFVARLAPGGRALLSTVFLGGLGPDSAAAVEVDGAGNAFVTGTTASRDFHTVRPGQATFGGGTDAFVAKIGPGPNGILPAAPSDLAAPSVGATQVTLRWADHATNEELFAIERSEGSAAFVLQGVVTANTLAFTDTGLTGGTACRYRVRAFNQAGPSGYSNTLSVTTPLPPPAAPSDLTALAPASTRVRLAWQNHATNASSVRVERKTGLSGAYAQIASMGAFVTTYTDSSLTANTVYVYRVRAANGGGFSAYSNTASLRTLSAPANLRAAAASSTSARLTWDDTSSGETGFRIERRPASSSVFTAVGLAGANTTSFTNTGLTPGAGYVYRVRAEAGSTSVSAYSNTAGVTTPR